MLPWFYIFMLLAYFLFEILALCILTVIIVKYCCLTWHLHDISYKQNLMYLLAMFTCIIESFLSYSAFILLSSIYSKCYNQSIGTYTFISERKITMKWAWNKKLVMKYIHWTFLQINVIMSLIPLIPYILEHCSWLNQMRFC